MAGIEGGVEGRQEVAVEVSGAVQERQVFRRGVVLVGANQRIGAIARTLQPSLVLTACAGGDGLYWDQLVSIQRRLDHGAIGQRLRSECCTDGRIETLQETLGRGHEDAIERRRSGNLGEFDVIGFDAVDWGAAVDVIFAEPGAGGEDLAISKVGKLSGRPGFGCAVTVAGENVECEDCVGGLGEGEEESEGEDGLWQHVFINVCQSILVAIVADARSRGGKEEVQEAKY